MIIGDAASFMILWRILKYMDKAAAQMETVRKKWIVLIE